MFQSHHNKASPYFRSITDNVESKKMFVGRNEEIGLLSHTIENNWIGVYGERRIGKTFLSFVFRDLVSRNCEGYLNYLSDVSLRTTVQQSLPRFDGWQSLYIDLLSVNSKGALCEKITTSLMKKGIDLNNSPYDDIVSLGEDINQRLDDMGGRKLLIILDEFEKLLKFKSCNEIFEGLRSLSQSCGLLRFIFVGSFGLRNYNLSEGTSPLINVIRLVPLKPINKNATRFLLEPLKQVYSVDEEMVDFIFENSGGNPCLIQSICQVMFDHTLSRPSKKIYQFSYFEKVWRESLEGEIISQLRPILDDYFFVKRSETDLYRQVAISLSHLGLVSPDEIASNLKCDIMGVNACLLEFQNLGKIKKTGHKYQLSSKLVEKYGRNFVPMPNVNPVVSNEILQTIQILNSQGISIGDSARVVQEFRNERKKNK